MIFLFYNLVLLVASPFIACYLLHRIFISGKSNQSWRQQMGVVDLDPEIREKDRVWIHAVSVGESVASAAVITELKKLLPHAAVLVSTTTQTGQEMARKSITDADGFFYYPFDLAPCVARSLSAVHPVVFASTDTEIWPNFRYFARKRGVKSAVINGIVSDKTVSRAKKVPWLAKWTVSNIDRFCMQSQADADRIILLGANPRSVTVTGNCKADQSVIPMTDTQKDELRSQYGLPSGARVFVAGSTNPGEDVPVIEAFSRARESFPDLRLIIAPRQIERGEEVSGLAKQKSLKCARRSEPTSISGVEDVIVLDTFGELAQVYAIADVSFVGGSLVPRGCHSILQPISMGKPVLFGPYTFKAKDLVAQAKDADVGFEVRDADQLGREVTRLLGDQALLEDIRVRCDGMMKANLGASKRTADALAELFLGDGC